MAGEPVTFTVAVSGTPEPDLQWLRDGVPIAGETSSTLLLSGVRDNAGFYSVIASNSAGSVESPAAELVVGLAEADVSFIVRDAASLNTNEASMHDALLELGHTVVLVSDSSDLPAKTAGTDLIVISGLARAAFLEDLFAEERRPIWLSQSLVFESMNLVVPGTSVTRSSNQQSINLLDTLGASAGALALGELRVVDRDKQFMTGQPVAAARVVATLADGTDRPAIFSLKRGDELADGSVAAGKRMAWFSNGYTARRWTSEGRLLFKQSIAWLLDSVQERAFAPVFISDPQSQSAAPGSAVSFSATATAAPAPSYQWLRNGLPVAGAIDSTLLVLATPDNVGSYQLIATNSEGVAASALANLTLELDVTPPMLVGVSVLADNALEVEFSEAVAESHAEIAANYVIDQGVTVLTATVSRPGVVLLNTSELPAATSFVLIVNNVEDASGNSLAPDSQVVFTRPQETISVALVVGSLSLSSTDEGWRDKLQSLGYLVEVVLDRRADSVTTAAQDIVIISGSARAARVADGFVADSRPVLVSEVFLYPTMGLTGAGNGSGFGFEQRQTEIELVASSSLPGTTNGPGALTITERNRSLNWGVPGADADLFATVVGEPLRATVFAYAAGATLANGELASGKRIAWHDSGTSALRWTPGGEVLFEQAIRWLLQN